MGIDWSRAVTVHREGIVLDLEVVPGAPASRFPAGYNAWRHRIQARLHARPEQGRANEELLGRVANFFGVPRAAVGLLSGSKARLKRVRVGGVELAEAQRRLSAALG